MELKFPTGFQAAGLHSGIKPDAALDLALIYSQFPCSAVGIFTTNQVQAAPVIYDREILARSADVQAVVINSGNANACTGKAGLDNTRQMAVQAAEACRLPPDSALVLSTGVIGVPLLMDKLLPGIRAAARALSPQGWTAAAQAIMTTDTRPKMAARTARAGYTIAGIAKGSGMIAPNMATMLAVIATDAVVPAAHLQDLLHSAARLSFNRIVVDGDMSTNDTVLLLANGAARIQIGDEQRDEFETLLQEVCTELAQAIVRDGEGATKFVQLRVTGAVDPVSAAQVGRAIATSPLCKTAFYGADPNWGRILCAAGYAGVPLDAGQISLWIEKLDGSPAIQLVAQGEPVPFDEQQAAALMQLPEWQVRLDLGSGAHEAVLWTCDLSEAYIHINGHYRT